MNQCNAKIELRKSLLSARQHINKRFEKNISMFNKLISNNIFLNSELVMTYVSKNDEIDTLRLIEYCFINNIRVAVPKVLGKEILFFVIKSSDDLEPGYFGILEPKHNRKMVIDYKKSICVVPCLACNKRNQRLGYGGGFYDRFLENYCGTSIGLCYRDNISDIPTEKHDIPLDLIITD